MLSSATCRLPQYPRPALPRRVSVTPLQPYLSFLDLPIPEICIWEQLTVQQKTTVIDALTRLMVKAASASTPKQEQEHD